MVLEVNWNLDDNKTNKCQVIKMTTPEDKEYFIDRNLFLEFVWAIGRPEDQQKMVPQTLETVHHYKTILGITTTKDVKKNEKINVPVELSIVCSALRKEVIGSLPKEYKSSMNSRLPDIDKRLPIMKPK